MIGWMKESMKGWKFGLRDGRKDEGIEKMRDDGIEKWVDEEIER